YFLASASPTAPSLSRSGDGARESLGDENSSPAKASAEVVAINWRRVSRISIDIEIDISRKFSMACLPPTSASFRSAHPPGNRTPRKNEAKPSLAAAPAVLRNEVSAGGLAPPPSLCV